MITVFLSIISIIISLISLISTICSRIYQKNKDNKLLKPQLFLESQKMQTVDYIGIDLEIDGYEKLKEYELLLKFTNIGETRIVDLAITLDVRKNDTFNYLLKKALEENNNNFYLEKDENGNLSYSWDRIFGMLEKTEKNLSVLESGNSFELQLPNIFSALLLGSMYSYRQGFNTTDSIIEFDMYISYKHALSKKNKYEKIKKTIPVNITLKNMIQGPHVVYDSIIFEQL
ncbi:TPA: hypothetical protein ACJHHN_001773 [Staphylococcus pseudintermedius]